MLIRVSICFFVGALCCCLVAEAIACDELSSALEKKEDAVKALDGFYKRRIEEIEKDFVANVKQIRKDIVKTLEGLKAKAAQVVELETANKIDERLNKIQSAKIESPTVDKPSNGMAEADPNLSGNWIGKWGTNNRSLRLVIGKDNAVKIIDSRGEIQELKISKAGKRFLVVKADHHDLELIRQDDRLVVLGWSKSKNRHIMVDPPNLMAVLVPGG